MSTHRRTLFSSIGITFLLASGLQTPAHAYEIYLTQAGIEMKADNSLNLKGVRIDGLAGISKEDGIDLSYVFDKNTGNFILNPAGIKVYTGIGTYSDWFFVRDVEPRQPSFKNESGTITQFGNAYSTQTSASIAATLTMDLVAGHSVSFLFSGNLSSGLKYKFSGPGTSKESSLVGNAGIITDANPILTSGTYTLSYQILSPTPVQIQVTGFNANNDTISAVVDKTVISKSFRTNLRDYKKAYADLEIGQSISLPSPTDNNITFLLLNSLGKTLSNASGLGLTYTATAKDRYYIFVYNNKGWGGSYSGAVTIK